MEELRIIHTADLHIGAPFVFLAEKGPAQRTALREALERIVAEARGGGYGALLIAGDLFDSAYDVSGSDLSFVVGTLAAAQAACTVVILPGSHDPFSPGSVYERELGRFEASGNVKVLTPARSVVEIPELSLAVHGRALTSRAGVERALASLVPIERYRWNIALAHGSIDGFAGGGEEGDPPLGLDGLDAGFSYVGLGHWHSYRVVRAQGPPVVYSGSPEVIARDQRGAGAAVSVRFGGSGARFETIGIGRRRIARASIDCTGLQTTEELARKAAAAAPEDRDLMLELELTGVIGLEATVDPLEALEALAGRYFSVRLAGKGPSLAIVTEELLRVPEDTVAGKFVRGMLRRIESAPGEKKGLYEEALQVGYQLFKGRNPLG